MRYRFIFGCGVALLSACRTTTAERSGDKPQLEAPAPAAAEPAGRVPERAAEPAEPIDVGLRVEALTSRGRRFIDSNEALRSGDRVALHVSVSEPAYLYVGHEAADGKRSVIFPQGGSELVAAGVHRIPDAGQWFKLDRDAGQEDLFVYASRKPLTSEQARGFLMDDSAKFRRPRMAAQAGPRRRPARGPKAAHASDEPGLLSPETRGLSVVGDEGSDVQADGDLTRVHFVIRHHK